MKLIEKIDRRATAARHPHDNAILVKDDEWAMVCEVLNKAEQLRASFFDRVGPSLDDAIDELRDALEELK